MTHLHQGIDNEHISKFSEILNELADIAVSENPDDSFGNRTTFNDAINKATILNPWFTRANIRKALLGLSNMMRSEALEKWLNIYDFSKMRNAKRIGLILAGNIPMVGFHDIFSVAVAGHQPVVKLSSQDKVLLPEVFKLFYEATVHEGFDVEWVDDRLPQVDAVIATGSNNTSRYFEYYFGKYPNIIRKNRSGIAILKGNETDEELQALGSDIFSFFGLGCRNVSKLYIHKDFDIDRFFNGVYPYHKIVNHNKYANNYDYYRALWMMNLEDILDNGFVILRPSTSLASPVGTVFYERYEDYDALRKQLASLEEEIQCIVSSDDVPFGESQRPELWDYADGVDTMEFLLKNI